jgi:HEPN domain-containing protein
MQRDRMVVAGRLVQELRSIDPTVSAALAHDAAALDLFYLTSRYSDSVGDADAADIINREDASVAVARAERLVAFADACLSE